LGESEVENERREGKYDIETNEDVGKDEPSPDETRLIFCSSMNEEGEEEKVDEAQHEEASKDSYHD